MENIALVTVKIPAAPRPKPIRSGTKQSSQKFAVNQGRTMTPLGTSQAPNSTFARSDKPPPTDATLGVKFVSAGTAACIADLATFPLDTAKVRLQVGKSPVWVVIVMAMMCDHRIYVVATLVVLYLAIPGQ